MQLSSRIKNIHHPFGDQPSGPTQTLAQAKPQNKYVKKKRWNPIPSLSVIDNLNLKHYINSTTQNKTHHWSGVQYGGVERLANTEVCIRGINKMCAWIGIRKCAQRNAIARIPVRKCAWKHAWKLAKPHAWTFAWTHVWTHAWELREHRMKILARVSSSFYSNLSTTRVSYTRRWASCHACIFQVFTHAYPVFRACIFRCFAHACLRVFTHACRMFTHAYFWVFCTHVSSHNISRLLSLAFLRTPSNVWHTCRKTREMQRKQTYH